MHSKVQKASDEAGQDADDLDGLEQDADDSKDYVPGCSIQKKGPFEGPLQGFQP